MIRFRNPGTQYSTQLQVIKQLYEKLGNQKYFSLDDMAIAIAQSNLMTAYGYAGDNALQLSNNKSKGAESMNSAQMNVKMYAEVLRMLGWVTPYSEKTSYPLVFTFLGIHMAQSTSDEVMLKLYEQCVMGINNPTELSQGMSYTEKLRFFKCALRSLIDLGGVMYKHELSIGPMSIDDENEDAYQAMIDKIKRMRGKNDNKLKEEFEKLSQSLNMKPGSVDNCTRLPVRFMKECKWVEEFRTNSLYGKSMGCFRITKHGRDVCSKIFKMKDLRLEEFNTYDSAVQDALIRIGVYSMLKRSGFDLSNVEEQFESDQKKCKDILQGKELLFSPCQTIKRGRIENALGIQFGIGATSNGNVGAFGSKQISSTAHTYIVKKFRLNQSVKAAEELLTEPEDERFLKQVYTLKQKGYSSIQIVNDLYKSYITATQSDFYPLISTLFKVMGYKCSFSRAGDNGSRWDAIIEDPSRSIPIEIKSPTEVAVLSIKAIRQALENKIVLLSRKTYITQPETTTLAVGYAMPGDRTDINDLIKYIKKTYGYRIGIIDFKTLLTIAISILIDGKGFNHEELFSLEGLMYASFS